MAENVTNDEPDYLGHRERLRRRFLLGGGRDMPDYELLELLLTIAISSAGCQTSGKGTD